MRRLIFALLLAVATIGSISAQVITSVPKGLGIDPYYSKYVYCNGIPIVSSWRVPDSCLVQVYKTLYGMTRSLKPEILQAMVGKGARVGVMARYEGTTDLPEHHNLITESAAHWDLRARGISGTMDNPLTTCAEENILGYQIDPFHAEDNFVRQFAQTVLFTGIKYMEPDVEFRLKSIYEQACNEGKFFDTYAGDNYIDYWAEGVQDWFNVNAEVPVPDGEHNWVNTREELKKYDPRLYNFIASYFSAPKEHISLHKKINKYKKDEYKVWYEQHYQKPLNIDIPPCSITSVPADVKQRLHLADSYVKYINCSGIHIMSSWKVPDSALVAAYKTVYAMTSMLPDNVHEAMTRIDTRVVVMGRYEATVQVPEHAYLANDTSLNWNLRARGLGGTIEEPITSCAEENVMAYPRDKYHAEDILIHEFSHSIHLIGILQCDPTINDQLRNLLQMARDEGKWENTYAADNFEEYWAEGVQDWFNVNAEMPYSDGKHNWVNTREDLKKYDPRLYNLIAKYFPETNEQISKHKKVNLYKK